MENDIKMTEWIYIIKHDAYPKWHKLGRTTHADPNDRLAAYNGPTPFNGAYFIGLWQVEDSKKVEELIIDYLHCREYMTSKNEWFRNLSKRAKVLPISRLFTKITKHAIREVELGPMRVYNHNIPVPADKVSDTESLQGESHG